LEWSHSPKKTGKKKFGEPATDKPKLGGGGGGERGRGGRRGGGGGGEDSKPIKN